MLGVGNESTFKAGSTLAGGVAWQGDSCGALTAALMALGWVMGRQQLPDREQYEKAMNVGMEIYREFKQRIGDALCREIQRLRFGKSFKLYDPQDRQVFLDAGGHDREACPEVCGVAAEIVSKKLLELGYKPGGG